MPEGFELDDYIFCNSCVPSAEVATTELILNSVIGEREGECEGEVDCDDGRNDVPTPVSWSA